MKIQKAELAQKLNKLKSVVPKKTESPVLRGVLVKDGYLIANNLEIAIKTKLAGTEGEAFIIPERAFDLINNLPDGDLEIKVMDENVIMIRADNIENRYQTLDHSMFPVTEVEKGGNELTISAETLLESIKRVIYAVPAQHHQMATTAMCLQASGGELNFVGLDGYVVAWDKVKHGGDFELLIPKNAVEKLKSIGLSGEVKIKHNETSAVFVTEEFEIHTRLIEGEYFDYRKFFTCPPLHTAVSRTDLLEAMTRAKMCAEEKCPVKFELETKVLNLSMKDRITDYHETVELREEMKDPLTIGFNARLVLETLKAFDCENVTISFDGPKSPMVVEAEDSDFKALVLPVMLK